MGLLDALSAVGRWAYPPVDARAVSSPARMAIPTLFFLLESHLLLRHSHNPLLNALRSLVIFPLACVCILRAIFGMRLPDGHHLPGPPGSISWGQRPHGTEETFSRAQAELCALASVAVFFLLKAAELGLARRPPTMSKERRDLLDALRAKELDGAAGGQVEGKSASNGAATNHRDAALRVRSKGEGTTSSDSASLTAVEDDLSSRRLPWFVPSTRIPLELDLAISMRAHGWSSGLPHPAGSKPVDLLPARAASAAWSALQARRWRLIKSALGFMPIAYLVADISDTLLKSPSLFGERANFGTPARLGGIREQGLRFEELSVLQRVAATVIVGGTAPFAIQGVYCIAVLSFLLPAYLFPTSRLLVQYTYADPSHWEPFWLFGTLWHPQSVRYMWSRQWHQAFSPTFRNVLFRPVDTLLRRIGLGMDAHRHKATAKEPPRPQSALIRAWRGPPGRATRRALATMSVFLYSGLMHEGGLLAMARTPAERDPWRLLGLGTPIPIPSRDGRGVGYYDRGGHMVVFFLMQGVGCLLEDVVVLVSGGRVRVGGVVGSVWTLLWFFGWGTVAAEPTLRRGLAQGWNSPRLSNLLIAMLTRRK